MMLSQPDFGCILENQRAMVRSRKTSEEETQAAAASWTTKAAAASLTRRKSSKNGANTVVRSLLQVMLSLVLVLFNFFLTGNETSSLSLRSLPVASPEENQGTRKLQGLSAMLPPPPNFANGRNQCPAPAYCQNVACFEHKRDVDAMFMPSVDEMSREKPCKMLWLTTLYEADGVCDNTRRHLSKFDYSIALNSMLLNAKDTLQPVLILGRYKTSLENSTEHQKIGRWAEGKGVKVLYSPRVSFQEDINKWMSHLMPIGRMQGLFMNWDIHLYAKEHKLFDMPNVCKDLVLFTDTDVIFPNPFTRQDVQVLHNAIGGGVLSFGRDLKKEAEIMNAGVVIMNVSRWEQELPELLKFGNARTPFPPHDQALLNAYQNSDRFRADPQMYRLLPMHYGWNLFWKVEPSYFSDIKILHLFGPKRETAAFQAMATCNITDDLYQRKGQFQALMRAVCCNHGMMPEWALKTSNALQAPNVAIC